MTDEAIIQLFGWLYLAFGIGILSNPTLYKKIIDAFTQSRPTLLIAGFISFVLGFFIVTVHNTWDIGWKNTIVSLFGWIILLKGTLFIIAPKLTELLAQKMKYGKHMPLWGTILLVAGIVFLLLGYFA